MKPDKRSVSITINNLDDVDGVLEALTKLFQTIFLYYLNKDQIELVEEIVVNCSISFARILTILGYDDKGEKNDY